MATLSFMIVLVPFVLAAIGISLFFVGDPGLLFFDEEFVPEEDAEFTVATAALIGGLIVGVIFAVWLAYRLLLWPPAIVANNAFALGEAWRLTRRKVWAQIAWSIVIASVILFILVGFVVGITSTRILSIVEATDFEYKFRSALSGNIDPNVLIVEFLFLFVTSTYAVAILSYAYKAMRGYDLDMPITDQRPLGPLQAFETSLTAQTAERVRAENQFSEHRMRDEA